MFSECIPGTYEFALIFAGADADAVDDGDELDVPLPLFSLLICPFDDRDCGDLKNLYLPISVPFPSVDGCNGCGGGGTAAGVEDEELDPYNGVEARFGVGKDLIEVPCPASPCKPVIGDSRLL
jgi:hypothetical protein